MPKHRLSFSLFIFVCLCLANVGQVLGGDIDFHKDIHPLLQTYCFRCHGSDKQEGNLRLDNLSIAILEDRAAAEHWHEVLNAVQKGEMPPLDEPQLTSDELARLTDWLNQSLKMAADAQRTTGGRSILRRLNRTEYQNTMQELLGLEMDYARDLPPDALSADGFQNNGDALQMSSLQLEYYLSTARRALDRVIVQGARPAALDHTFTASNLDDWLGDAQRSNQLGRKQEFLGRIVDAYPDEGDFCVRVQLTATLKPNTGFPLLEVSVGYRPDTEILMREFSLVEITSAEVQTFEFRGRLENFPLPVRGQSKYPGLVIRVRNVYDDKSPLPKEQKDENGKRVYPNEEHLPTLTIQSVEFQGNAYKEWPPPRHQQILFDPQGKNKEDLNYVSEVIKRFMTRAFRRPVGDDEVARLVAFYQSIRPEFPSFEETMRETLAMVLIQPDFLFLIEPAGDEKRELNEHELASRLSYFLWSSLPDENLMRLANEGKLRESLPQELERMLNDSRAERFTQQFTDQWLKLNLVANVAVNANRYPGVDASLKEEMCNETRQLFGTILKENLSIHQLLSGDFTMLNEPLAKHYGIGNVFGRSFRRVPVPADSHRGSLLSHASILLNNSTGSESHPIRRAVFIRDRLLNDPPPPPPPNVPTLEQAAPEFHQLSIRKQLEIHRTNEACNQCHKNLDPWGLALENLDPVGRWRTETTNATANDKVHVVDSTVQLPDGTAIQGVQGLKSYLTQEKRDDFAKALVTRMLSYALGRYVDFADQAAIDQILTQSKPDSYRLRDLVRHIVMSEPFQTK